MWPAGSRGPAQMPPRGGGHQARDRAASGESRGPARALPHPGPHAPISKKPLGGVGGRNAKSEKSEKRCSVSSDWTDAESGGPLFMLPWPRRYLPWLCLLAASSPSSSPSWWLPRHRPGLVILSFGPLCRRAVYIAFSFRLPTLGATTRRGDAPPQLH